MTGPEHYREAENLVHQVTIGRDQSPLDPGEALKAAQVHATLALAAATALGHRRSGMPTADLTEWCGVSSADAGLAALTESDRP